MPRDGSAANGNNGKREEWPDFARPPKGKHWMWITQELVKSVAWRSRSIHCIRFVDFLLDQHMSAGGLQNGQLLAQYDHLQQMPWSIGRRFIRCAIEEAVGLGLVEVIKSGRRASAEASPSRYRLKFYATRELRDGKMRWVRPTDEWRAVTLADVMLLEAKLSDMRRARRGQAAPQRPSPSPS